jgi:hypothetical protein
VDPGPDAAAGSTGTVDAPAEDAAPPGPDASPADGPPAEAGGACGAQACGKFACGPAGACLTTCRADPECAAPNRCNAGQCGGLTGEYFDQQELAGTKRTRVDPVISFDFGTGAPIAGIGADSFSVRWTGKIIPRHSEVYTFTVRSDDGARLWVGDARTPIIDAWVVRQGEESNGNVQLEQGREYSIRLEYFDGSRGASVQLFWSSPSQRRELVPTSQLVP